MKTCPQCGRRYNDEAIRCALDGKTLVDGATADTSPDDPETVVRPRQAQPLGSPRFTEISIERQPAAPFPSPGAARVDTIRRASDVRPVWPVVAAIILLVGVTAGVAAWWITSTNSDLAREVGAQITDARVQVADAKARLETLPTDSPLRGKILQLQDWDRELQRFELSGDRTRDMAGRAREIAGLARSIGEEARVAGAIVSATPPVVPPAALVTPPDAQATTAGDPMGDPAATTGGEPKPGDPAKPTPDPRNSADGNVPKPDEKPPAGDTGGTGTPVPKPGDKTDPPKDGTPKPDPKPDPPKPNSNRQAGSPT